MEDKEMLINELYQCFVSTHKIVCDINRCLENKVKITDKIKYEYIDNVQKIVSVCGKFFELQGGTYNNLFNSIHLSSLNEIENDELFYKTNIQGNSKKHFSSFDDVVSYITYNIKHN